PGLQDAIEGHLRRVEERIGQWADVVSGGLIDTAQAGADAGESFAREDVDLLLCYMGTYATSTIVLPVVQRAAVPVILLNLQPVAALDYADVDTATWLANAGVCAVPEFAGVFLRSAIEFDVVTGTLDDDPIAWEEVRSWCVAAGVARTIRRARFGMLGHTYPGMLDMSTDVAALQAQLGAHIEILEIDDLKDLVERATSEEVAAIVARTGDLFVLEGDISQEAITWGATVAAGLQDLAADFDLDGLAYYYRGTGGDRLEQIAANMILGNTLLTAEGIPAAGEGDLKTAIAMKILDELGAGGSFTEFAAMDFQDDFFLMGHDGPAHPGIGDGKPTLKELAVFHGKSGGGLAVEIRARTGPVTVLGVTQTTEGRLKLIAAEGESLPGDALRLGNSNHRIRFGQDVRAFMRAWCALGPTHHVALGLGHRIADLQRVATLLDIPFERVGPE
ncbi:MAG TPA: L-fucose/L-arabinose isomerase family protein, partial [Thermomicrobiales bacterium]|nr:L-fucose/L-arabinose isomerase family protein [Thermomicrobiales bacterium]